MEASTETKKTLSNRTVIVVALLIVLAVVVAAVAIVLSLRKDDSSGIGYSTEASVILDQAALQAAMDEAMRNAESGNVALLYKDNAFSSNGTDFKCYIVNSASNAYDMFLTIFADPQLTDQLFLSSLVPPGSGFESIRLEHPLEEGTHTVYVALTQVDRDENGVESVVNQVVHTMTFHVQK